MAFLSLRRATLLRNVFFTHHQNSGYSLLMRSFSRSPILCEEEAEKEKEKHPCDVALEKLLGEQREKGELSKKKLQKLKKLTRPYPPPPDGLTVERFLWKIGKDCYEHAGAFEGDFRLLMSCTGKDLKAKDIKPRQRRHILTMQEKYRTGILDLDPAKDRQVHKGANPPVKKK